MPLTGAKQRRPFWYSAEAGSDAAAPGGVLARQTLHSPSSESAVLDSPDAQLWNPADPRGRKTTAPSLEIGPHKPARRMLKRGLDVIVAGTVLVLLAPMLVMIAAVLRATSGGPVIYAHPRVGRNGRMFRCYKFRTMHVDGDRILESYFAANPLAKRSWIENQKLDDDPRVTVVGRMLRKTSLDELPQFFNILLGDMSCVGPRPVAHAELDRYGEHRAEYLSVRPGLTGIWQISGRSRLSYANRVLLDADYVQHWSLRRDLLIMLKTLPAVLKTHEAA